MNELDTARISKLEAEVRLLRAGLSEVKRIIHKEFSVPEKLLPSSTITNVVDPIVRIDNLVLEVEILKTGLSEIKQCIDSPKKQQVAAAKDPSAKDPSAKGLPTKNGD